MGTTKHERNVRKAARRAGITKEGAKELGRRHRSKSGRASAKAQGLSLKDLRKKTASAKATAAATKKVQALNNNPKLVKKNLQSLRSGGYITESAYKSAIVKLDRRTKLNSTALNNARKKTRRR